MTAISSEPFKTVVIPTDFLNLSDTFGVLLQLWREVNYNFIKYKSNNNYAGAMYLASEKSVKINNSSIKRPQVKSVSLTEVPASSQILSF